MEINLKEQSLSLFIELLSSKEPAPGGGGAAALTASQGCALAAMVCNLTVGKKKYQQYEEDLQRILKEAKQLQERFLQMIQEDKDNFMPLAKAYGIKAETEEEKSEKAKVMEEALRTACKVPIEIVEKSYQGILLHQELLDKGSKLAISDVGVGVEFLRAALISGKMNVRINTGMMTDEVCRKEIDEKIDRLTEEGVRIADEVSKSVMQKL